MTFTVRKSTTTDLYLSECDQLDLMSQGRTEQEALDSIQDTTRLYLKHCGLRGITPKRKNQS